jgi:hypothetical protein
MRKRKGNWRVDLKPGTSGSITCKTLFHQRRVGFGRTLKYQLGIILAVGNPLSLPREYINKIV